MRKPIVGLAAVVVFAFTPAASGHPSENRADQGFFFGPHWHINQHSGNLAFPSHRAHIATGTPVEVFAAAPCPP